MYRVYIVSVIITGKNFHTFLDAEENNSCESVLDTLLQKLFWH